MIAFVFSGGGNRGALQVGAVQALLDRGIVPDLLVGASVGAINAGFLASDPHPESARSLEEVWHNVTNNDVYPGSRISLLWRILKRQSSLFSNDNLYQFLCRQMPSDVQTFDDVKTELYITATKLQSGSMHIFGERPTDSLLDAIMASSALPPLHPPWVVDGDEFVDGGAVSGLPLRVAVSKGARTIYALHLFSPLNKLPPRYSWGDVASRAVSILLNQQVALEHESVFRSEDVTLHYIKLHLPDQLVLSRRNFSHSADLIPHGRQQAEQYLEANHILSQRQRSSQTQGVDNSNRLAIDGPSVI